MIINNMLKLFAQNLKTVTAIHSTALLPFTDGHFIAESFASASVSKYTADDGNVGPSSSPVYTQTFPITFKNQGALTQLESLNPMKGVEGNKLSL